MNFLPENPTFADILDADVICNSQPISLPSSQNTDCVDVSDEVNILNSSESCRPSKHTGQQGEFRSIEEIDPKYRTIFTYPYFNLVQSRVIEDALYSDKSMVICAPTGSGKTVVFEMAIAQLLMDVEDTNYKEDFKIIYMAPVKALCTERLTEWYPKFTKLGLLCIEVTGDTDVEFPQLKPYKVIITTPEKWDMLTRRWRDYRSLVEVVKLFLIDEVHILNDNVRGPVLEAVVSRMKTIESSVQSAHRIEQLQKQYGGTQSKADNITPCPRIRFVAVSATVNNPEDVASWLGAADRPAVYYKFGDECRPVKLVRIVEGYPCPQGTSIFKFDIILNYKLWPIIQRYHNGKPTLIFCNTRKSVALTAEALSREITINFNPEQKAKLMALASTLKNRKLQTLALNGVGCHHAGLLFEERLNIERAFRNRYLPILITTTTLAMGVNLPAHLVIIKNTQQYVNGAYQEYSISTILQMVGRAGRPQFDTEATAVIMTRLADKARYQALVEGTEPLQSFLHKRLAENLNSEAALGTVTDVAQCVQWVNSTFLSVRAVKDPRRYLGLPQTAPAYEISKKIEELCVKAMNGLASSGLITMDEASCIESTEAGKLMSVYYIDLETMKLIMKIEGSETLDRLLWLICESHELCDMHLRVDERRCLNTLNRSNNASTIRFPMKGKISSRQMKLSCIIQAVLGCLPIPDPSLNQEAMKIMRIALRVCKCLVAYTTRPTSVSQQPKTFSAVLNCIVLTKCLAANLWENSHYVSKQLRGIGPAFSMLLASAGKTSFLLLEESHPRDLERIMNKGPPAGNVIRKQISLLPKYQLSIIPIDRDKIQIRLTLLNQAYLSENLEQFTAGVNHKSYIIVGDSENYLLYLTSFKDTDLINIYDGCITCDVTRKHGHEHKILAHCISSSVVGIDVQTEYLFIEIGPVYQRCSNSIDSIQSNILAEPETIRKRKLNKNVNIAYSKEKIKRGNAILQNFKNLKESFGKTSKEVLRNINISTEISNDILQNLTNEPKCEISKECLKPIIAKNNSAKVTVEDFSNNEDIFQQLEDEDQVNNILNAIENEMSEAVTKPEQQQQTLFFTSQDITDVGIYNRHANKFTKTHKKYVKSNFDVVDILEKETNAENNDIMINDNIEGFTNTVKFKIDKYLQNAQNINNIHKDSNDKIQVEAKDVIDIKNDNMIHEEQLFDCSLVHENNVLVHGESAIVDENPNTIQNTEKESHKGYLVTSNLNDNRLIRKKNDNIENIIECKEVCIYNRERVPVACSENNNTTIPTLSSLDTDKKQNFNNTNNIEKQNNNNALTKNHNDYKKKNRISTILSGHKNDSGEDIFSDVTKKEQGLSDNYFLHKTTKLCLTPPLAINVSNDSNNITPLLENTNEPTRCMDINITKVQPNLDSDNKLCETNGCADAGSSCLGHISDNSEKLEINQKSSVIDIHQPCSNCSNENISDFQRHSIIAQNGSSPNCNLNTSNDILIDYPIYKNQGAARIEKHCFRTTKFDIHTENYSKHTVKIISKLKIDLDITKIISTKGGRLNTCEPIFSDTEKIYQSCNTIIDSDLSNSKMDIDILSPATLHNNMKEENINKTRLNDSKEIIESSLQKLQPKAQEIAQNKCNTRNFNKIEDILEKYKTVMKSKPKTTIIPVTKQINTDNIIGPSENKPKRRFNIKDIINFPSPSPKINATNYSKLISFNNKLVDGSQDNTKNEDVTDDLKSPSTYTDVMQFDLPETTSLQTEFTCKMNSDYKIDTEILSPKTKLESPNTSFNLNNTVLNPKTLLECYNGSGDTEEILPPPPEFADTTNQSIHFSASTTYSPSSPDYNPEIYHYVNFNEYLHCDTTHARNIFNDFSRDDRTPSEEDNTWSSSENYLQDNAQPFPMQNQIHKAIRNDFSDFRDLFSNNKYKKLGDFKYKHKNVLKLKK